MDSLSGTQRFVLKPFATIAAAVLLLLVGVFAMVYQFRSGHAERLRQVTAQANTLAASVTAAIAFDDRVAAGEYVHALMLDPRLDAVAVYDDSGRLVAAAHRQDGLPIPPADRSGKRPANPLLVEVPARQGSTIVGSIWVRGTPTPWTIQLARLSGVALLTVMAVVMLSVLGLAQRMLTHANANMHRRAEQLADANAQLHDEMEQRSRAEEALRQSQKMEAVGQLSGGIAHDFNNMLMTVKAALALLESRIARSAAGVERVAEAARARIDAGTDQDVSGALQVLEEGVRLAEEGKARRVQLQHYLDTANHGIDKAADLTKRLLAFARRQPLSPTSVQLDALIRGMQPLLVHSVGPGIRIEYRLDSHWHVLCDSNQMENAVLNLVINARDAMPDGGRVTISTVDVPAVAGAEAGAPGECVELRVADTGTGMSEDVRSRALDPFFTTKPVGKGTGLGLSTIVGYVMQSNGQLRLDSTPGAGTTVSIVLPRQLSDIPREVA